VIALSLLLHFLLHFAFLVVIPEGDLLFVSLKGTASALPATSTKGKGL
jgi:hypothetical protein